MAVKAILSNLLKTYEERVYCMNVVSTKGSGNCTRMRSIDNVDKMGTTLETCFYPNELQVRNSKQNDELDVSFDNCSDAKKPALYSLEQGEDSIFNGLYQNRLAQNSQFY